jgi:SAM-dependent methyltransferase
VRSILTRVDQIGARGRKQREIWDARTQTWKDQVESSDAFGRVRNALFERAEPAPSDHCADLGSGTGFVTLSLARQVADVLAVDISPEMLTRLRGEAIAAQLTNIQTRAGDLAMFDLPSESLDLVVSSYVLHSLPHQNKVEVLKATYRWLRPGGRLVIADMMLGRGLTARDRRIFFDKVRRLSRRGPAGLWRAVRNTIQLGLGVGENRPATPEWWIQALREANFIEVRYRDVVAEAGVVAGIRP